MNEPSVQRVNHDLEALVHVLLDCILEGKPIKFSGVFPQSVLERLEKATVEGKLSGYVKEKI